MTPESAGQIPVQTALMLARLAAGRSARGLVFGASEKAMRQWSDAVRDAGLAGHGVIVLGSGPLAAPAPAPCELMGHALLEHLIDRARGARDCHRAVLVAAADLDRLPDVVLGAVLDALHHSARGCLPLGAVLLAGADSPRRIGDLRSFAETLLVFGRIPSGSSLRAGDVASPTQEPPA